MGSPYRKPILGPTQRWRIRLFLSQNPAVGVIGLALILSVLVYVVDTLGVIDEDLFIDGAPKELIPPKVVPKVDVEESKEPTIEKLQETWSLTANDPILIGGFGDNIDAQGEHRDLLDGELTAYLHPADNYGKIITTFTGTLNPGGADIKGTFTVRFSDYQDSSWTDGGIAQNVNLFGDSGNEPDYLPELTADVATKGFADIYLDDQLLYSHLNGIFVYGNGAYRSDGKIRDEDGKLYEKPGDGFVEEDKEAHLFLYSVETSDANRPEHEVFIHLLFEEVGVAAKPK